MAAASSNKRRIIGSLVIDVIVAAILFIVYQQGHLSGTAVIVVFGFVCLTTVSFILAAVTDRWWPNN